MYFHLGTFWNTKLKIHKYNLHLCSSSCFGFVFGKKVLHRYCILELKAFYSMVLSGIELFVLLPTPLHAAAAILASLSQLHTTRFHFLPFNHPTLLLLHPNVQYQTKFFILSSLFFSSAPPLQRRSLFIRKEIAGLIGAEEVVLLHLHHVLRLIRFLKLQTVH